MTQAAELKPIASKRIDEVLADIDKFLVEVQNIYASRAVGPYDLTTPYWCEDLTPGPGFPGSGPLALRGEFHDVPTVGVTIEGVQSYFSSISEPCGKWIDTRASALAAANALLDAARSVHTEELQRVFLAPAVAIRASAEALKKQLSAP